MHYNEPSLRVPQALHLAGSGIHNFIYNTCLKQIPPGMTNLMATADANMLPWKWRMQGTEGTIFVPLGT